MSGVTCQFCGKPLWRIRRGSEGDFCSRDHRNQYTLRMGLTQLAEAAKVSTIRRRCEVCNSISLGRAAGTPETQKRRSSTVFQKRQVSRLRLPGTIAPSPAGLQGTPAAVALHPHRPPVVRSMAAALGFPAGAPPLRAAARTEPLEALTGVRGRNSVRALRVPIADGALSRPVFLIARFAPRRPHAGAIEPSVSREPLRGGPVTPVCRPRAAVSSGPRVASIAFQPAPPPLHQLQKKNDLADIPCVPYALMPYRVHAISQGVVVTGQGPLLPPAPASPVAHGQSGAELLEIGEAGISLAVRALHVAPADCPFNRKWFPFDLAPAGVPVMLDIRLAALSSCCGFRTVSPDRCGTRGWPQARVARLRRSPRPIGSNRRAVWAERVRLPGLAVRRVSIAPAGQPSPVRVEPFRILTPRAALPALGFDRPGMPEAAPFRLAAGRPGVDLVRHPKPPRYASDLFIPRFRPSLKGVPGDPLPGPETRVVEEHFASGLESWTGDIAGWKVDVAGVRPAAPALFTPSLGLADYRLEFLARVERGSLTCLLRAAGPGDCHVVRIGSGGGSLERYTLTGDTADARATAALTGIPAGKSLNVGIDVCGDRFSIAVNGRAIDQWSDSRLPSGGVGFASSPEDRVRLYWVRLTHVVPENQQREVTQS